MIGKRLTPKQRELYALVRAVDAAYDALPAEHEVKPLDHYAARVLSFPQA